MKKILFVTLILGLIVLAGCAPQIVCNKPYILVGKACCLDENSDLICDADKPVVIEEEKVIEEIKKPEVPKEVFDVQISYADQDGKIGDTIFSGQGETGYYAVFVENKGDIDAVCTIYTTEVSVDSRIEETSKRFEMVVLAKQRGNKTIAIEAPKYALYKLTDKTVENKVDCDGRFTADNKFEEFVIERDFWYTKNDDGVDLNKETEIIQEEDEKTKTISVKGIHHEVGMITNDQVETCTIFFDGARKEFHKKKTELYNDVKITLISMDHNSCSFLFW